MPTSWHVTVGFASQLTEETPFDIAEELEEFGAVASVSRALDTGTVDLTVEAADVTEACNAGARLVVAALANHGATADLTSVTAQTEESLEAQLRTPAIPEVVGYAEIAHMAGVTRQRARQFADIEGFPKPAIVTAQGPLMTKASVARWLDTRSTRRSAKPAHA